ncbi:hypothetical protein PAXINDRAFT_20969 [Paxillus involutus ATCC 200175]|uniref:Uncharacterized protein n=1 Tax=Paxillus involutus ATCC 200175 TaxID=664439 RepID=A0A0C9TC71_PAXIN|nr:hypothetical protein PAXINDRAFT_20969 [Paxillus involutus ATCC 200175]
MEQAVILCEKIGRHSIKYYFEEIMQRSHLQSKSRKVTRWNAFIRCEVARHNSVLPEGAKQLKPSDLMPEICVHWKELSEEQRVSKTQKSMVEIEQLLKMKELAGHHMMQNTFSDAQKTLEKIDHKALSSS